MSTLIRSSLKLLFRNKGFWFFLILLPLLSSLILGLQSDNMGAHSYEDVRVIEEQKDVKTKVAYFNNSGAFVIKVFDASGSDASEYLLEKLAENGAFFVARAKTPDMTREEVLKQLDFDGENDRMGAAIYLDKDFDQLVAEGKESEALTLYVMSEDERFTLLEEEVKLLLQRISDAQQQAGVEGAGQVLFENREAAPKKSLVFLSGKSGTALTKEQEDQKSSMGYAFAIMTLGYVLSGVFIAHTILREEHDKVLTRLRLTGLSSIQYFCAKYVTSVISAAIMTIVLGICTMFLDASKFGMGRIPFLLMMFLMGLIFSSISLDLGVIMGDVMSATIAAFTLWSMSSLLAGTYFPLDAAGNVIKAISALMPQKWFLEATEMIFLKDSKVVIMLLCVTVAYLVVAISMGAVGTRFRNSED